MVSWQLFSAIAACGHDVGLVGMCSGGVAVSSLVLETHLFTEPRIVYPDIGAYSKRSMGSYHHGNCTSDESDLSHSV